MTIPGLTIWLSDSLASNTAPLTFSRNSDRIAVFAKRIQVGLDTRRSSCSLNKSGGQVPEDTLMKIGLSFESCFGGS